MTRGAPNTPLERGDEARDVVSNIVVRDPAPAAITPVTATTMVTGRTRNRLGRQVVAGRIGTTV